MGSFEDYFLSLTGWERFRASQFGIRHYCTIALNPKEANNPDVAQGVLDLMPRYLEKDGVVAVGEIGFDDMTQAEDRYFHEQLELARTFELPVLVHTPHRDKKRGTVGLKVLTVLAESDLAGKGELDVLEAAWENPLDAKSAVTTRRQATRKRMNSSIITFVKRSRTSVLKPLHNP